MPAFAPAGWPHLMKRMSAGLRKPSCSLAGPYTSAASCSGAGRRGHRGAARDRARHSNARVRRPAPGKQEARIGGARRRQPRLSHPLQAVACGLKGHRHLHLDVRGKRARQPRALLRLQAAGRQRVGGTMAMLGFWQTRPHISAWGKRRPFPRRRVCLGCECRLSAAHGGALTMARNDLRDSHVPGVTYSRPRVA